MLSKALKVFMKGDLYLYVVCGYVCILLFISY